MVVPGSASLDRRERRVLARLIDLLREALGEELRAVWLYGSRARGERPSADSDVDLIVVTQGGRRRDLPVVTRLVTRAADAEGADPTRFAAHVFDPETVAYRREIESFFFREVDRDKIVLFGSG
jgi:predicted nucleotidyltransferase